MSAYAEGLRTGIAAADSTMAEVDRDRTYRERLVEKAAATSAAKTKLGEDQYQYDKTSDETNRHNLAMEGIDRDRWPAGGGGGGKMTPEQRMSIARGKLISDHTRNQIAGVEETPEQLAAYQTAVADEHEYLHPGGRAKGAAAKTAADAAAKAKADAAGGGGMLGAIGDAFSKGATFFTGPDAPPPAPSAPAGWKPRTDTTGQYHETAYGQWVNKKTGKPYQPGR